MSVNLEPLNPLTEIFLVSFSILYGIMLSSLNGLVLFQFGQLFTPVGRIVFRRIAVSFIAITLAPVIFFAIVLLQLQAVQLPLNMKTVVGVFFLSLSVFIFYRVLHLLISLIGERDWLYDLKREPYFNNDDNQSRIQIIMRSSWEGQLVGVIVYGVLGLIGWLLLFN